TRIFTPPLLLVPAGAASPSRPVTFLPVSEGLRGNFSPDAGRLGTRPHPICGSWQAHSTRLIIVRGVPSRWTSPPWPPASSLTTTAADAVADALALPLAALEA